jgi:hypothetical protein
VRTFGDSRLGEFVLEAILIAKTFDKITGRDLAMTDNGASNGTCNGTCNGIGQDIRYLPFVA